MNDLELIFTMLIEKKSRLKSQEARPQRTSTSVQRQQKKEEKLQEMREKTQKKESEKP